MKVNMVVQGPQPKESNNPWFNKSYGCRAKRRKY